jgi:hypothetical protein
MQAFLSYQTGDKLVAGRVGKLLESLGISVFMAHEDIGVSEEWRLQILKALSSADLFVPILSERYFSSVWCVQETGIAAFRDMTMMPLSIDGTIPLGFMGHIQSTKINGDSPNYTNILPGLAKRDVSFLISCLIKLIGRTRGYRATEAAFELILPYIPQATREQIVELLTVSTHNDQVCNAGTCAQHYLPPLVKSHGRYMKRKDFKELKETLGRYGVKF